MIVLKKQPPNSNLCGQTCIAMICNISIFDSIRAIGKSTTTTGVDLSRGLRSFGVKASPKMIKMAKIPLITDFYKKLPSRCIAKVRARNIKKSHWILIWDGKYYDPDAFFGWEYISGYIKIEGGA